MSTRSNQATKATKAEQAALLAAIKQGYHDFRGQLTWMDCIRIRVSPLAWYVMMTDPILAVPVYEQTIFGIGVDLDAELPEHVWRLVASDAPETVRAAGTYGHA